MMTELIIKKMKDLRFLALLLILLLGIFLRTYNFHDLLRFHNDQARDVGIVQEYLEGGAKLPDYGPKAGGTQFRLGPIFYHFGIVSAWLFGISPTSMAYPDLFFSILSIGVLFLLLRKYYSQKTAGLLSALYAISFFAIKYARFAWNPNSEPFWTMLFLFGFLQLFDEEKVSRKKYWAIVAGISLGVGIQLHTTLLVLMPLFLGAVFVYTFFKKIPVKKFFLVALLFAALTNSVQISAECANGFRNTAEFFRAQQDKQARNDSLPTSLGKVGLCTVQANAHLLGGFYSDDGCDMTKLSGKRYQKFLQTGAIAISILFTIGSFILLGLALNHERSEKRKRFLLFVLGYFSIFSLLMVPIAADLLMRFYLGMIFVPFVFLGLWFDWIDAKLKKGGLWIMIGVSIMLFLGNGLKTVGDLRSMAATDGDAESSVITLGELEKMSEFINDHAERGKPIIIDGKNAIMFHVFKPLKYVASTRGLPLHQYDDVKNENNGGKLFIIVSSKSFKAVDFSGQIFQKTGQFTIIEQ